jgi:hypothetical protein
MWHFLWNMLEPTINLKEFGDNWIAQNTFNFKDVKKDCQQMFCVWKLL